VRRAASLVLAACLGIAGALAVIYWITEEPCVTDTECGCTDDCLEPAK
jgi:hypothetical protein